MLSRRGLNTDVYKTSGSDEGVRASWAPHGSQSDTEQTYPGRLWD